MQGTWANKLTGGLMLLATAAVLWAIATSLTAPTVEVGMDPTTGAPAQVQAIADN